MTKSNKESRKYSGHHSKNDSKEHYHLKSKSYKNTQSEHKSKDKNWRYKYIDSSNKKKYNFGVPILIGSIIIILLFLGGYFILQSGGTTHVFPPNHPGGVLNNITNASNAITSNNLNKTDPNILLYESAVQKSNYSICLLINDTHVQDECLGTFSNTSVEACSKLNNISKRYDCISQFAKSNNLISLCNYLNGTNETNGTDYVSKCKLSVDSCYGLNGTDLSLCKAKEYNDSTLCFDDQSCILGFVKYKNDSTYCDAFNGVYNIRSCKSYITGTDYCAQLDDSNTKQLCYMKLAQYTLDSSYCQNTVKYTYAQNECYYRVALGAKDPNLCKYEDLTYRSKCYEDYAEKYSDPTGCMEIDPLAKIHYNNCFIHLSLQTHNASLCVYLPAYLRESCYASAIYDNTTYVYPASNCDKITDQAWKTACYQALASRTNDTAYCNYIENDYSKQRCLDIAKNK